jgi:tagaturonate epimerase
MAAQTAKNLQIAQYSFGMGDRFGMQGRAQLRACMLAAEQGVRVDPVWNKSNREHMIVGTEPSQVRLEADNAVRALCWDGAYFVDADHINLENVDRFIEPSDFFTLDVAAAIGKPATVETVEGFTARHPELLERIELPGGNPPISICSEALREIAGKYIFAVGAAACLYRRIESSKGEGRFITEVSMDETDLPQTPAELLVILAALADEKVPLQTIAPKFTGRFNKGVDYVGDPPQFEAEFRADVAVIAHAVRSYGLPENLKLSVHSGSDKFTIYPIIRRVLKENPAAGVHVKTAGTTWLEELIGLAEAGGEALDLAKEVYSEAHAHCEELCAPYASVIDIDVSRLPDPSLVRSWTSEEYTAALRHEPGCPAFDPNLRQLLHVGYKIAAKMGDRYYSTVNSCEETVARNVTLNLYERHLRRIFI